MGELRQNLITGDWVIVATERARRPHEFGGEKTKPALNVYEPSCPFCPGNESMTQTPSHVVGSGSSWNVRVVPNKYPALTREGERHRVVQGIRRSLAAVGVHEVVIENRRHDLSPGLMKREEVRDIITVYRDRYRAIREDERIEAIIIFRNHGEAAGTSLQHPHSQILATPMVPTQFRNRIQTAIRYFDEQGVCMFCATLKDELQEEVRLIYETEHFVAFIPYAALSPFHLWIFPRRHSSSFDEITNEEAEDLAENLRTVLAKIHRGLGDPDYNYTIRTIPTHIKHTDYFHWYLTIIPRITRTAGFELGSGMFINTSIPEESAKFLREIDVV